MGLKSWVKNLFGRKVTIVDDPSDSRDNYLKDMLSSTTVNNMLSNIRNYSTDRESEIKDYREMLKDGITLSAVELIAEDASILDPDTNQCAWVVCPSDPDFGRYMTQWLNDSVHINELVYSIAFNIVAYGECFLATNYTNEEYRNNFTLGDYFTIADPLECVHLYKFGVPLGYMVNDIVDDTATWGTSDVILPEKSYIHFISDRGQTQMLSDNDFGFYAKYGTSFLAAARSYYKQRQLLEDLLILSRLTRSTFYRIFSVEVGNATSQDTARMMREVKTAVTSKQTVSVVNEVFSSKNSPILTGGNVYVPVRDGKGALSVQDVGGEVNISALADIDYFSKNYYSALHVPPQFLQGTSGEDGGLGESSLTQLDVRYARTVKRVQRIIREGIRQLVLWKSLIDEKMPPEFSVQMTHILTAEDEKRATIMQSEADRVNTTLDLLTKIDEEILNKADKRELIYFVLHKIYRNDDLLEALGYNKPDEKVEDSNESKTEDDEVGFGGDEENETPDEDSPF